MGERLISNNPCALVPPPLPTSCSSRSSLRHLRRIFAQFDGGLRDVLKDVMEGWEPPHIVMIGQESSGKSSILERLCMMPIFPRGEDICTRLPIHVRLRHATSDRALPPRLEVRDTITGECIKGPFVLPCATGHVAVREHMEQILREEQVGAREVSRKHTIILHIESCSVPSMDLVDLPGLVVSCTCASVGCIRQAH